MNAALNTRWWAIENAEGVPLADATVLIDRDRREDAPESNVLHRTCRNVLIFSRREYAEQMRDASGVARASVVIYDGRSDAARFLAKCGELGADAFVVDAGQPHAHWFSIHREDWQPLAVTRARAEAIGLEVV